MDIVRTIYGVFLFCVAIETELRPVCSEIFCVISGMRIMAGDTPAYCCRAVHIFACNYVFIMAAETEFSTPGNKLKLMRRSVRVVTGCAFPLTDRTVHEFFRLKLLMTCVTYL
jgi:hypothetical protein